MMKKIFMPIFAALALTGCSDDVPSPGNEEPVANGEQFLAVDIVSQGGGASRADDNGTGDVPGYEDGTDGENGTVNENEVKGVRLYFFTSTGDAVSIKKNVTGNYYDIPTDQIGVSSPSQDHSETVEKILKAVVVVEAGERLPAKVVAVINPILTGSNSLGTGSLSLSSLRERCIDYASYANGKVTGSPQFVMSNSVYMDVNGMVDATPVSAKNFATSREAALLNPIQIYVERTVAKVRLDASPLEYIEVDDGTTKTKLYKLLRKVENADGTTKDDYLTLAEKESISTIPDGGTDANGYQQSQVFLKLDAWDVTADCTHAWLLKLIDQTWPRNYLGPNFSWNSADYHRSFWADECNPMSGKNENQYYAYNDGTHFKQKLFDGKEGTYCNENAERSGDITGFTNPKVLIKGTICDEAGNPLMISEYGGNRFIDDSGLTGLKTRYIEMLKGSRTELPWCAWTDNGVTKHRQLAAADLDLKPVEYIQLKDAIPAGGTPTKYEYESGRYRVYPCLSASAAQKTWYKQVRYAQDGVSYEVGDVEPVANINGYLLDLSYAMVWKGGKTYYYFDIQHLGDKAEGNWGTVRNHIYDIDITKIYGLGTPVYDETLTIEPEKPQDSNTYVAAQVKILQWRVVPQSVVLDWD